MKFRTIKDNVYWLGAEDWDRRLFDSLIPLPDGTSYNAYIVKGNDKTVLIDSVDPKLADLLLTGLEDFDKIDYVISNHSEQDHSGSIPFVLEKYPEAKVIATPKGASMLGDHLCIAEEKFMAVEDGQELDLGGKSLKFIHTPWVHWPETMCTYLVEDKVLFSCDFFGSHIASTDQFVTDKARVYEAAKRYYAEIMMPFRTTIRKNLEKLKPYQIDIIGPSHGSLYNDSAFIIEAYKDWISDEPKNLVVLPYISMHGSTQKMVDHLVVALAEREITVQQFELSGTDIGKLAMSLVDAATIVIGTPTVHVAPHPAVIYAAYLANALRPKLKYASVIGSYGWATKAVDQIAGLIPNLKVELINPVICKGYPRDVDFAALDVLADTIAEKHKANGYLEKKGTCASVS